MDAVRQLVSVEDYMENYAADFYEWVHGEVVRLVPVTGV